MTTYDPNIIQKFAERLYAKAKRIIAIYTILGFVIGYLAGPLIWKTSPPPPGVAGNPQAEVVKLLMTATVCSLIGLALGVERAFWLKFRAQMALCQMHIEKNTKERSVVGTSQAV